MHTCFTVSRHSRAAARSYVSQHAAVWFLVSNRLHCSGRLTSSWLLSEVMDDVSALIYCSCMSSTFITSNYLIKIHSALTNFHLTCMSVFVFSSLGQVKVFRALFTFDPRTVWALRLFRCTVFIILDDSMYLFHGFSMYEATVESHMQAFQLKLHYRILGSVVKSAGSWIL